MTLDAASVVPEGCFDCGMAYVAASRVRSIEKLRFRRNCARLDCDGCDQCRLALRLADIKVQPAPKRRAPAPRNNCSLLNK